MCSTVGLFALAALLTGAYRCVLYGRVVVRFDSTLSVLPIGEALAIVRVFGPAFATLLALLVGVSRIDRLAGADAAAPTKIRWVALRAGALAPLSLVPATALLFLGSLAAWIVWWHLPFSAYVATVERTMETADITYAAGSSLIGGAIVTSVLLVGQTLWRAPSQSRGRKIAAAIAMLVAVNWLVRLV